MLIELLMICIFKKIKEKEDSNRKRSKDFVCKDWNSNKRLKEKDYNNKKEEEGWCSKMSNRELIYNFLI